MRLPGLDLCLLGLHLADEAATESLGASLAGTLEPGMRVYLSGQLGAGKTSLVRGILRALGFEGRVKSPTYTLVEPYSLSRLYLYHFDFYRFHDPSEWTDAGFREIFDGPAVCLVEWPERAMGPLPEADVALRLTLTGEGRDALIEARTETGAKCLSALRLRESSF